MLAKRKDKESLQHSSASQSRPSRRGSAYVTQFGVCLLLASLVLKVLLLAWVGLELLLVTCLLCAEVAGIAWFSVSGALDRHTPRCPAIPVALLVLGSAVALFLWSGSLPELFLQALVLT